MGFFDVPYTPVPEVLKRVQVYHKMLYFSGMRHMLMMMAVAGSITANGQAYWQQRVDVKLDVKLNDVAHVLDGFERITYTNNSPDTLRYLYVHLWPNAYKNDHTPFAMQEDENGNTAFYYSKASDKGYIDSLDFKADDKNVEYFASDAAPDIARIDLPKWLLPGQKLVLTTPFRVKVPKVFSRLGHTGQAYFISQWFPKPAVYDRKGWHPISYLDQGEFFSEYGSYDVSITLPKNYVVMATGNCTDDTENKWLDSMAALPVPDDTVYKKWFPPSSTVTKTIHYHEDNIHDFAWFADKRWAVTKDTVYSPGNGKLVTTWSAFLPSYKKQWAKSNDYLKETVRHYGKWVGPYPYSTVKAVLGDMHAGGGMEYPTVTVIDKAASNSLRTVVVHEAGHNWFYGILGSMERDHAWMDEGMNTFYEQKTTKDLAQREDTAKHKAQKKGISVSLDESLIYYEFAATGNDQTIDEPSENFTKLNYGVDVYYKTNLMLRWLEQYMGADTFGSAMHAYYDQWKFKHPYPEDFKKCLAQFSHKDINWFFDVALNSNTPIDFKIKHADAADGRTMVTVKNKTGAVAPVYIAAYQGDSLVSSIWSVPFKGTTQLTLPVSGWTKLKVDKVVPDYKTTNNTFSRSGLHTFHPALRPIVGLNITDKSKLFVAPALGYNMYNGFMAGLVFHNITVPETPFKMILAPMYAVGSGNFVGTGAMGYHWFPAGKVKDILAEVDAKTFGYNVSTPEIAGTTILAYYKVAPSLNFTFRERDPRSPVERSITLKGYLINEQVDAANPDSTAWTIKSVQKVYGLVNYNYQNRRTYNPYGFKLEGQGSADFVKLTATGNARVDYNSKGKSLYVRAFFGKFFAINTDPAVYGRYELNGTYSGISDYLYDGTYIGRSTVNALGAQQVAIEEGGFKVPVYNRAARSDNWMGSINLETDLPLKKSRFKLFFDAGLVPNANQTVTNISTTTLLYDGGIMLSLIPNTVCIYVPLLMSSDFNNYLMDVYGHKNVFAHSISFTLQLQNYDWLKSSLKMLKLG